MSVMTRVLYSSIFLQAFDSAVYRITEETTLLHSPTRSQNLEYSPRIQISGDMNSGTLKGST